MASKLEQIITEISGLTVIELADLVKQLEQKFGVSAAMPAMGAAAPAAVAGAAAAKVEEKSQYKVELIEGGADKIKAIKAVRSVTPLGLQEARKAVEEVPSVLAEAASKEDAQKMKEVLEAAGAKVKLS